MSSVLSNLGNLVRIRTGKLDANANDPDGLFPFFTCARESLRISTHSYDCECVLVAGNGDLNVKYYNGKFDAYQRTYIIESLSPEVLDVRYLYHFMDTYLDKLRHMSIGGVIKYIKIGNLTEAELPLPPIPEQRRIAAILDQADALRAKRRKALAQLDSLTQSIFIEMFGDPATNPKSWNIRKIGDLLDSASYGTSEKSEATGDFPVLRMNNITRTGEIDLNSLKYMNLDTYELDRYLVKTGDILFNRTNSAELVGKSAIVRHSERMAYAGYLVRLRSNAETDSEYLAGFLNTAYAKKMLRGMCKSIIGMANINAKEVQAMKIAQPPTALQHEYGLRIKEVMRQKDVHRTSLAEFDELFASLQHRAFRGEL